MDIVDVMDKNNYLTTYDVTIADLKELGECITDDMSIGALMECVAQLYDEATYINECKEASKKMNDEQSERGFYTEGWVYFWHKDESASYDVNDLECGTNVYVSAYEKEPVCDGYSGMVGKIDDMREKAYCRYFVYNNHSEQRFYIDDDGEEESCEIMWCEIVDIMEVHSRWD